MQKARKKTPTYIQNSIKLKGAFSKIDKRESTPQKILNLAVIAWWLCITKEQIGDFQIAG